MPESLREEGAGIEIIEVSGFVVARLQDARRGGVRRAAEDLDREGREYDSGSARGESPEVSAGEVVIATQ